MNNKANERNDRTVLQAERLKRYARLIEQQTGRAIRPARLDGYVNLINRYGTEKDTSEHYQYQAEPIVPDETLTEFYEGNGLFAKIIDAPAEEAVKHGFSLNNVKDQKVTDFYQEALEELDWEETAINSIRWARLFGGSIAVMLINDGRGIDEPLDWKNIQSIDDIRVYDRSVIQPDYASMFTYAPEDPFRTRGSRLGMPEYYHVFSKYGSFVVHESRCLVFRNGVLPENCSNSIYELWGMPEYIRIRRAIRDSELAHSNGPKLLEKSVQAVYKMKDLASELSTEEGEGRVLRRLQVIDMARGMLNSIAIDNDNEDYDFKTFQFTGVSEIIDTTCNQLSALTSIPQTILFGRSPAGMNSTGTSDMENWYNFVERIQKRMLKSNLRYLLSIIFQAGVATGEIDEVPPIKPKFEPLWSLSELEEANLQQTKAATQQTKASTAQIYVGMQAIDPSEVRKKLAESDEFDVENMLDDLEDEDLESFIEGLGNESDDESHESQGNSPDAAPAATKLPQDMTEDEMKNLRGDTSETGFDDVDWITVNGTHVPLDESGIAVGGGKLKGKSFSKVKPQSKSSGGSKSSSGENKKERGSTNTQIGESVMDTGKGVDTIQEAATKIKGVKIEEPEDKTKKISKPFFEKIGFCGKPSVVSENDFNSSESDYPVQYRGIDLNDAYEKFVGDDFFVGSGANGDGTNTTPNEITAKKFAGKDGVVIEIKLDKSAKVISDTELMGKMGEFMNAEPPEGVDETVFYHLTSDPGCIAASLGYDAISDSSTGWLNIVNRSKMIVKEQETSKSPHTDGSKNFTYATIKGKNSFSVGVIVVSEGKILCGRRHNDFGYGLICGPGGHIEPDETPEQAAFRETEEEFGISPKELIPLGYGPTESETGLTPILFLCTDYIGKPDCVDLEITNPKFMSLEEIEMLKASLFQPFADSLQVLIDRITTETIISEKPIDKSAQTSIIKSKSISEDGGKGSGNFGHKGIPGETGGSTPTASSRGENPKCKGFADSKKRKAHINKHLKEYPEMDAKGYVQHAKDFISQPCSDKVDGYATAEGEVVRFDRTTGEYGKGVPGGKIVTCYIAKFNAKTGKSNLDLANKYFDKLKEAEGVEDDGK